MFFRLCIISSLVLLPLVGCEMDKTLPKHTPDSPPPTYPTPIQQDGPIYTNDQVSSFANASLRPLDVSTPYLHKRIVSVLYSGGGIWQVKVDWEYESSIDQIAYLFDEQKGHFEIDSITIIIK